MAILASSAALTRYRILEKPDSELLREVPDKLTEYAFKDIDHTSEERSFGWTNLDDMLDMRWRVSPPEKGNYFAFSLRLDTRRIQPAVFKKHVQIAMNDEMAKAKEEGKNFISRDRKKEIKEQVKLKLMARSLPIPAVFDVVWDISKHHVWLGTTNAKVTSLFEDLFNATFELNLEPMTPFFMALNIIGEENVSKLENLDPTIFIA